MKKSFLNRIVKPLFWAVIGTSSISLQSREQHKFLIRKPDSTEIQVVLTEKEAQQFDDYYKDEMEATKRAIWNYDTQLQQQQKPTGKERFKKFTVTTPSGIKISGSFFDRGSSTLIVAGQGFQHTEKSVYSIAALYPDCDVVTLNYRWALLWRFVFKFSTLCSPLQQLLLREQEEVRTIVNHIKQQKRYDKIIGHAICYSTYTFLAAQTQAQEQDQELLFDKIILDSTFATIEDILEKLVQDPFLFFQPQIDHTHWWWKSFLRFLRIPQIVAYMTQKYANASIPSLLSKIKNTPILFIHGQADVLIPLEDEFSNIWNAAPQTTRFAYLTPFKHVMNFPKNRGLYRKVCELFIHYSPEEFPHQFPLKLEKTE